ncbi:MAG: DUF1998 domain-containing protein [Acidimicrobiia bacterium]|nr:DUF1998 domain-containing protein [Acidimicrobiia bacterium]
MSTGNVRRSQLVTPFGVGAMSVLVNGTSVITAGLDHWYEVGDVSELAIEEYIEHDWRLEARLRVKEFRLPPDYRFQGSGQDRRNVKLMVPVLRFPRWCFCLYCKRLELSTLTMQQNVKCLDKQHADQPYRPRMSQVPFVTMCSQGHLDDFPFDKWVHRSHSPNCSGVLRLTSRGGGGLEGQVVKCEGCDMERPLRGITEWRRGSHGEEHTTLTDGLSSTGEPFLCTGARPWLGELEGTCGEPMRGALRAAGNVYFPKVESSIYLPRREGAVSAELHDLMRRPNVGPIMRVLYEANKEAVTVEQLRQYLPNELFAPISDEELMSGFSDFVGLGEEPPETTREAESEILTGDDEWRYPEYLHIRELPKDDFLTATDPNVHSELQAHFGRVRRIDVLRETRALRGFSRVRDGVLRLTEGKALLRRSILSPDQDWLPAYVVKGEGIYFELEPRKLASWEARAEVNERADKIMQHYGRVIMERGLQNRRLTARFVMLHTLGHLLVNELVFTCGYSSASLRERLYVSNTPGHQMTGLLIYTAAGDSEGTMGGLVRMARPELLRSVLVSALRNARWCSTDPVCMEAGKRGQGPDSCNLAACHGCALVPETSCEEFNRFLDRGLVVGTFDDPTLGYFSDLDLA